MPIPRVSINYAHDPENFSPYESVGEFPKSNAHLSERPDLSITSKWSSARPNASAEGTASINTKGVQESLEHIKRNSIYSEEQSQASNQ